MTVFGRRPLPPPSLRPRFVAATARTGLFSVLGASVLVAAPVVGGSTPPAPRVVAPSVRHVDLGAQPTRMAGKTDGRLPALSSATGTPDQVSTVATTAPLVALTWAGGQAPAPGTALAVRGRTSTGWTDWQDTEVSSDTDTVATRARHAQRVGTDPIWLGPVSQVQVRFRTADGTRVRRGRVELIQPGTSPADAPAQPPASTAVAAASRPTIISRAGWGADESLVSCDPYYGSTTMGLVLHHTAGTNSYTASQSAALVRGIYAYHTKSLGWCDIGYNVLVDRYGQIFEGRRGGLDLPVTGAHALGFNTNTWGVSVLGNFDSGAAPAAAVSAVERVMAWRSSRFYKWPTGSTTLTSSDSGSRYPEGTRVTLPFITGHRDTYSTACPGANLYSRLPAIRTATASLGGYGSSRVYQRWLQLGGPSSFLGWVYRGERTYSFGAGTVFQQGRALWATPTGVWYLGPGLNSLYEGMSGPTQWGYPVNSEQSVTGGSLSRLSTGRVLMWSAGTGGHSTIGAIRAYWESVGGPGSSLGFAGGEIWQPTSSGWLQSFAGGAVLYTGSAGAHAVSGAVATKYWQLGGPSKRYGYPAGEVAAISTGTGQAFQGGAIYTEASTGTFGTTGAINTRYASLGGPRSALGFPVEDEKQVDTGVLQTFQHGWIRWDRQTGEVVVQTTP